MTTMTSMNIAFVGWRLAPWHHTWCGVVSGSDRKEVARKLVDYLKRERGHGRCVVLPSGEQPGDDDPRALDYGRPPGQVGKDFNHERLKTLARNGDTTRHRRHVR
jgi:hypothetical protein